MKKILSCFLIFVLAFSFFGCNAPEEQNAFPTELTKEPAWQDTQTDVKEPVQQDTQSDVKEPEKVTPLQTEKGEFCPYTIDDYFRPYEIFVVLTKEESKKDKEYTVADFDALEIISVFEDAIPNYHYYHPNVEERKILLLMLKNPSKQTVLDYIEILKTDNRVYLAAPNLFGTDHYQISLSFDEKLSKIAYAQSLKSTETRYGDKPIIDHTAFKMLDCLDIDFMFIDSYESSKKITVIIEINDDEEKDSDELKIMDQVYKAAAIDGVVARPEYKEIIDYTYIKAAVSGDYFIKNYDKEEYTLKDFEGVIAKEMEMQYSFYNHVPLYVYFTLSEDNQYTLSKSLGALIKNPIADDIYIDDAYRDRIIEALHPPMQKYF